MQHDGAHDQNIDLVPAMLIKAAPSRVALALAFPLSATPHDIGLLALRGMFKTPEAALLASLVTGARVVNKLIGWRQKT